MDIKEIHLEKWIAKILGILAIKIKVEKQPNNTNFQYAILEIKKTDLKFIEKSLEAAFFVTFALAQVRFKG